MLTAARAKHLFHYDCETGVFTWRNCGLKKLNGQPTATSVGSHGYHQIYADGKMYVAHRVAWLYANGKWPKGYIDHVNGVKTDNRICNLREASQSLQNGNTKRRKSNRSGFKGVDFKVSHKKWRARIAFQGKHRLLGYFKTPELAHAAYRSAAREVFGQFARYE